jgi:hypothetical protein
LAAKPAEFETRLAAGDEIKQRRRDDGAGHLHGDIGNEARGGKPSGNGQAEGNGGIEMAARYAAHGIGHGKHGQAERQRHAEKTDPELGIGRRKHGTAAPAENQPERSKKLGNKTFLHVCLLRSQPESSP